MNGWNFDVLLYQLFAFVMFFGIFVGFIIAATCHLMGNIYNNYTIVRRDENPVPDHGTQTRASIDAICNAHNAAQPL